MSRAGILLFVAFFSALLLPRPAAAEPELWTCTQADGATMFTDHVPTQAGCPQTSLFGGAYAFGSPYPFWPIFGANRFVYSSGGWIVEITFGGGRVVSINQPRLRP